MEHYAPGVTEATAVAPEKAEKAPVSEVKHLTAAVQAWAEWHSEHTYSQAHYARVIELLSEREKDLHTAREEVARFAADYCTAFARKDTQAAAERLEQLRIASHEERRALRKFTAAAAAVRVARADLQAIKGRRPQAKDTTSGRG